MRIDGTPAALAARLFTRTVKSDYNTTLEQTDQPRKAASLRTHLALRLTSHSRSVTKKVSLFLRNALSTSTLFWRSTRYLFEKVSMTSWMSIEWALRERLNDDWIYPVCIAISIPQRDTVPKYVLWCRGYYMHYGSILFWQTKKLRGKCRDSSRVAVS